MQSNTTSLSCLPLLPLSPQDHIRSVCDKYNLTGKGELDSNEGISIDKEHKLILCENPKVKY